MSSENGVKPTCKKMAKKTHKVTEWKKGMKKKKKKMVQECVGVERQV